MARSSPNELITAIDIGTTKICVFIARKLSNDQLEIIGVGKASSYGLAKGVVVDIGKTVYAIKSALKEAEMMATVSIDSACVGIAGSHIKSSNSHGVIPIKKGVIQQSDIDAVLAAAQAIPLFEGDQLIHCFPQYFIIDGKKRVENPIGMHGIRLEVSAHLIFGSVCSVQDIISCCQQAGVTVDDVVLEPIASARAVLSPDEQLLGVAMLDIGGGTSDLALYQQNSIRHTKVIPIAGNHITNDLAIGLRTTISDAERIKKEHAIAFSDLIKKESFIEVELVEGCDRQIIFLTDIARIIQPRVEEILELVKQEIDNKKLNGYMTTGLVLTGGGSLLHGMRELAERIFMVPVRIGKPHIAFDLPESLKTPIYATGYGLLLYAAAKQQKGGSFLSQHGMAQRIAERMKAWILDIF